MKTAHRNCGTTKALLEGSMTFYNDYLTLGHRCKLLREHKVGQISKPEPNENLDIAYLSFRKI